jgi:hypothetical protein
MQMRLTEYVTGVFPYLSEDAIERDAEDFLAEYAQARGVVIEPPIPIEDIVEKHLKLRVEFDDIHRLLGSPRSEFLPVILGAMVFKDRRIVVDESLDPEEYPSREGDYRLILAHEGCGHWRLHSHLFTRKRWTPSLEEGAVEVVVGTDRLEPQAEFYAHCVLMPRKLVVAVFEEIFPDRRPRIVEQPPIAAVPSAKCKDGEFGDVDSKEELLDRLVLPLADHFLVPPTAMRVRLERLGLLQCEVTQQRILAGGA